MDEVAPQPDAVPPYVILVVDDSATMRELLSFAVRRIGEVDVVEASNGAEALAAIANGPRPDLVIADINMPVMNGLIMLEKIRADPALKDLLIVIVTTEKADEERATAMSLGANAYVTKPIKAQVVADTLKQLLPARAQAPAS
jgi:two-component system, chemotaxis family, chemotaxis protein CheY